LPDVEPIGDSRYPLATAILDELGKQMPFMLRAAKETPGTPLAERLPELEFIGARLRNMSHGAADWIARAVKSYVVLSLEFLKLQKELEKTGRYLHSSERETLPKVYSSERVFGGYYLAGLLLSEALWPNHFVFTESFVADFASRLPKGAKVLEVGVGTGYHLAKLFNARPDISYLGIDVSQFAIDFARKFASDELDDKTAEFVLANATAGIEAPLAAFDAVVCGEVLEHVDDPAALLAEIKRVVNPSGTAFVTTVAFAANIDHVFLFENAAQIRALIVSTGWRILNEWVLPVYAQDTADSHKRPLNYGAVIAPAS
jgi:ubiquinone/menaquinone biosynthesis C-methylase UbiE